MFSELPQPLQLC